MAYEKTLDLLDLAIWMQSTREGVSLSDIEDRYGVSRRTAERMRNMLADKYLDMQVIFGENNMKRWHIPRGTINEFINFSAEELAALDAARTLFNRKQMGEKAELLRGISEKINALLKPNISRRIAPDAEVLMEAEGFICRPGPKLKIDKDIMMNIRQAILECHRIQITYFYQSSGKSHTCTLDPHGFLYGERNHYLVARHSDGYFGNEVHNFILSNISAVKILNTPFTPVPGFSLQKYAELSFGAFHEEPFEVEWLFDPEAAAEASHYIFHPSQTMRRNPDGSLTVCFKAGGRIEMDWHLYTWSGHVKVIKPANWDEMKKAAQTAK